MGVRPIPNGPKRFRWDELILFAAFALAFALLFLGACVALNRWIDQ